MSTFKRHTIDRLGILSSGLCAVHCAAIPLLISFGLIGTLSSGTHMLVEWMVIISSLILGSWSVYNALRSHGRIWPQVLIALGAFTIVIGFIFAISHILMAAGGLLLVIGHWFNWRLLGTSHS